MTSPGKWNLKRGTEQVACRLSPISPQKLAVKAGKLLLHEIQGSLECGIPSGLGRPLGSTTHTKLVQQSKTLGYQVESHYLWIPIPALAIRRIAQRFKKGGHSAPESDVKRRFSRSPKGCLKIEKRGNQPQMNVNERR